MAQVRSFGIYQTAKFVGTLYAVLSAIIAVPFALIGGAISVAMGKPEGAAFFLFALAPILYGVIGFLSAGLAAWVYNFLAARIGGIEVEIG